jgi:hypothetical protein
MTLDTQEVPDLFNSSRDDEIGFSKTGYNEDFPSGLQIGIQEEAFTIGLITAVAVG